MVVKPTFIDSFFFSFYVEHLVSLSIEEINLDLGI